MNYTFKVKKKSQIYISKQLNNTRRDYYYEKNIIIYHYFIFSFISY